MRTDSTSSGSDHVLPAASKLRLVSNPGFTMRFPGHSSSGPPGVGLDVAVVVFVIDSSGFVVEMVDPDGVVTLEDVSEALLIAVVVAVTEFEDVSWPEPVLWLETELARTDKDEELMMEPVDEV